MKKFQKTFKVLFSTCFILFAFVLTFILPALVLNTAFAENELVTLSVNADNAKVYININGENTQINNTLTINKNQNYSIEVVSSKYYYVQTANIVDSNENVQSMYISGVGEYSFHSDSEINVETKKLTYDVKVCAVDDAMYNNADLNVDDFFDIDYQHNAPKIGVEEAVSSDSIIRKNLNSTEWKFLGYKVKNQVDNTYDTVTLDKIYSSSDFDKYLELEDGKQVLNIFAVFTKLYEINVYANNLTFGNFIVEHKGNGEYIDITNQYIRDGVFTYYAANEDSFKIFAVPDHNKAFLGFNGVLDGENVLTISDIQENKNIVVEFGNKKYKINIAAFDSLNEKITGYEKYSTVFVNGNASDSFSIGDKITGIVTDFSEIMNTYKFVNYQIYNFSNGWENLIIIKNSFKDVTENFISKYVGENQTVYIRANYIKIYEVSIKVEDACVSGGYFNLSVEKVADNTTVLYSNRLSNFTGYFEIGTRVRVEARANSGFEFTEFTLPNNLSATENIITKYINHENVNIGMIFNKVDVNINIDIKSNNVNIDDISSEKVMVGDKIVLACQPYFGNKINKICINNVNISEMDNVELNENAIIIDVTSEFLSKLGKGNKIILSVDAGVDSSYVFVFVVIPILLICMLTYCIIFCVLYVKQRQKLKIIKSKKIDE